MVKLKERIRPPTKMFKQILKIIIVLARKLYSSEGYWDLPYKKTKVVDPLENYKISCPQNKIAELKHLKPLHMLPSDNGKLELYCRERFKTMINQAYQAIQCHVT